MALTRAFVPNRRFLEEVLESGDFQAGLTSFAEEVAALAEVNARAVGAPWMPRAGESKVVKVVARNDGVFVVNTDHAGHLQEWGSKNNPPHAPLRRAAMASGLRVGEDPTT